MKGFHLLIFLLGFTMMSGVAQSATGLNKLKTTELRFPLQCTLKAVARYKNIVLKDDVELPTVHLESLTPLTDFQNAVTAQWSMKPEIFSNVYVVDNNQIYLIDNADYYKRTNRFMDDSLAHELTHYLQVKYQKYDLNTGDDSAENEAVGAQTWFRETFMVPGSFFSPCED